MKNKGIYFIVFLSLLLTGCKTNSKKTASKIQAEAIDFDYYTSRAKIKVDKQGMDFSVLMNLRMQKDKLIWINLSNTMIGKVGKCKITPDSVFVLRDFQAKEYYKGSIADLNKRIGYELSYEMVQKIFFGEMPLMKLEGSTIKKENGELIITQKESLFTLENYLNPKTKKLNRLKISQVGKSEYLELIYSDYEKVDGRLIPTVMHLQSNSKRGFFSDVNELKTKYQKNKFTTEELSFPFKVTSRYEYKKI